jgi:hypothetical protein
MRYTTVGMDIFRNLKPQLEFTFLHLKDSSVHHPFLTALWWVLEEYTWLSGAEWRLLQKHGTILLKSIFWLIVGEFVFANQFFHQIFIVVSWLYYSHFFRFQNIQSLLRLLPCDLVGQIS